MTRLSGKLGAVGVVVVIGFMAACAPGDPPSSTVSAPSVSALSVSAPSVSAPSVSAPSVSAPSVSAPSVSAPAASAPAGVSSCAEADRVRDDGLLKEAEEKYVAVLSPPKPAAAPASAASAPAAPSTASPAVATRPPAVTLPASTPPSLSGADRECALAGVVAVRQKRVDAAGMVAAGEHALETGQYNTARKWFERAQATDLGNKDAQDGLVDVQRKTGGATHPTTLVGYSDPLLRLALAFLGALAAMLLFARLLLALIRPAAKPQESSSPAEQSSPAEEPDLPRELVPGGQPVSGGQSAPSAKQERRKGWGFFGDWAWPTTGRKRGLLPAAGVVAALVGAAGAAWVIAGYSTVVGWFVLLASVVAGGFAALVLASWLSRRLRVRFEVRGAGDALDGPATAFLVARVAALGGQRPQGLTMPSGTDVVALRDEALAAMPQNAVLKALLNLGWSLVHRSPWRVTVTMSAGDRAIVEIARNGRPAVTEVLWTRDVVPTDDEIGDVSHVLLNGAAALVLITLARTHAELAEGLCGTVNWRSLTKQVLAAEPPYASNNHARKHLLAEAINVDPGNKLAWYAYLLALIVSEPALVDGWPGVARRLDALYKSLPGSLDKSAKAVPTDGYTALRVRILYSSTVGWLRHGEHRGCSDDDRADALKQAEGSASGMANAVEAAGKGEVGVKQFADETEPVAAALKISVETAQARLAAEIAAKSEKAQRAPKARSGAIAVPAAQERSSWRTPSDEFLGQIVGMSLRTLYVVACGEARSRRPRQAFAALGLAVGLTLNREGALTDPALRNLRNLSAFRQVMAGQPDIGVLPPITPHLEALHAKGVFVPGDLLARPPSGDLDLASATDVVAEVTTGVTAHEIAAWRELCRLLVTCPEPSQAAAWTNLLLEAGITSPAEMRRSFGTDARRRGAEPIIAALAVAAQVVIPKTEHLRLWAEEPAKPEPDKEKSPEPAEAKSGV